jgi:hypothetical protein
MINTSYIIGVLLGYALIKTKKNEKCGDPGGIPAIFGSGDLTPRAFFYKILVFHSQCSLIPKNPFCGGALGRLKFVTLTKNGSSPHS